MANHRMHYRYGASTLDSALPLPALQRVVALVGDVIRIVHGLDACAEATHWRHHWCDGDDVVLSLARHGTDYWLRFPGLADFQLQVDAGQILLAPNAAADDNTLEHLIVDQVLPRFLAHRAQLVAHASAVTLRGRQALFLGPSGWGKSTLAGLLQRHGHSVYSDDCVQLRFANGRYEALPTYPSLRLYSDSLDAVFPATPHTARVASYTEKLRVSLDEQVTTNDAVPVDALYVLGDPAEGGATAEITPLSPSHACQALIAHSFRLDLGDRGGNAGHFARCAAVVKAVPAFRLDYPRDYGQSGALVETILQHLSSLPAAS